MNAHFRNGLLAAAIVAVSTQSAVAVNLWDGLISYWPLTDATGTTATDTALGLTGSSGTLADNGTLRNGPTWVSSKFGAGLQFDGTSQDVLIPASTDMDINTQGVTISAWVKLDQLPSALSPSFGGILDSQPDNYVLYLDRGNQELRFKATNASGFTTATPQHPGIRQALLNTTDWFHVMGVFDGVKGRSMIYLNGQLVDKTGQSGTSAGNPTQDLRGFVRTGQVSTIGAQATTADPHTASNWFPGMISDVAVWNRSLGGAEAQYLYNSGTGNAVGTANPNINPLPPVSPVQPTAQPVIYYKFDGNLDNSGTGGGALNATLVDTAGVNDTLFTPATFGSGLNLQENPQSVGTGGDHLTVNYTLPESGTIATRFTASTLYNFQTLWANSVGNNNWESWIYVDGRMAARVASATGDIVAHQLFMLDDASASHHYAFTWTRQGANVLTRLYVDGEWVDERINVWGDPGGLFSIGGGGGPTGTGNNLSKGLFDEFRIYNSALSEAEILYLSQNAPETVFGQDGDFNMDGKVDAADYVVWRKTGTPQQYALWRANFGSPPGSGSSVTSPSVPEPGASCFVLLAIGAGGSYARLRKRLNRRFRPT
jgi:hypothetical protein